METPSSMSFINLFVCFLAQMRRVKGIQRGSVQYSQSTYPGDPTTPGRPSVAGVSRLPLERANIPHIPVQPIGYGDAEVLLRVRFKKKTSFTNDFFFKY